ncbi:hypothetical protein [Chryseobacterium geocarposphaerae]|uniref:Uncharacterized protein n=1 Tax=Chryseobacterium geocarposphaerae TaxID=1416776 RepID=A0A2M9C921_9FLAO|nr:hypothetical protein [Chryseobacterium geocarposphaerae]PJJ67343.1 hypothetical protein CLV73_1351 [Chryseobacterium geocarposphaerae]
MTIKYYLNLDNNENLYCQLVDEEMKVSFNMQYRVDPSIWNCKDQKISDSDIHFFTLKNFEAYLFKRYYDLIKLGREGILEALKEESLDLLKDSGIDSISRNIFDMYGRKFGLDSYDEYLQAFEKFTGLEQKDYKVKIIDYALHFHTKDEIYEMDTYLGRSVLLKEIIKNKRYLDIVELTDADMWSEIYDENIGKHKFLSKMSDEFEICLNYNFKQTGVFIGSNENIETRKDEIRKMFQKFVDESNKDVNWIDLAWEISEDILFPLAVITMTSIFDLHICCQEYCELNFYNKHEEWETIFLDCGLEEDDNSKAFHIRLYR